MIPKYKITAIAAICLAITSCGGGGNSSVLTGVFIDSAVVNINYRTETQNGVTDSDGRYSYVSGEKVVFSIGNLNFPEANVRSALTPLDLADTSNINDSRVVNMIRLLQTLDTDGIPGNGIVISDTAKDSATKVDFTLSTTDFANSTAVTSLIFNAGQVSEVTGLVSATDAVDHFESQLNDDSYLESLNGTYIFNGTEMTITSPEISFDRGGNLQFNLKNNNQNPRQLIQLTTTYSSKPEFDNAFTNNRLVLSGDNVRSAGAEYDGRFNNSDQNSFSATITTNENGTYNFVSEGVMSIPIRSMTCSTDNPNICSSIGPIEITGVNKVTQVVALNIQFGER